MAHTHPKNAINMIIRLRNTKIGRGQHLTRLGKFAHVKACSICVFICWLQFPVFFLKLSNKFPRTNFKAFEISKNVLQKHLKKLPFHVHDISQFWVMMYMLDITKTNYDKVQLFVCKPLHYTEFQKNCPMSSCIHWNY